MTFTGAAAESLDCAITCTEGCENGPATGRVLLVDRNATPPALILLGSEGILPGKEVPKRLSGPFGWEGRAVSPSVVDASFDGETGQTVLTVPPLRPGDGAATLKIGSEGPAYPVVLEHLMARTLFRRRDVSITYVGTCEVKA